MNTAMARFWRFSNERLPWPEIVGFGRPIRGEAVCHAWRLRRHAVLKESWSFLLGALHSHRHTFEGFDSLFDAAAYSELCGQLELTCIWLRLPCPFKSVLREPRLSSLAAEIEQSSLRSKLSSIASRIQDKEEAQHVPMHPADGETRSFTLSDVLSRLRDEETVGGGCGLPDVLGMCFFAGVSLLNHSCRPNVELAYLDSAGSTPTLASVRATGDCGVVAGQPLTLSYLDLSVPWAFKDRQKHLLEGYGFACACDRCTSEAAELTRQRSKRRRRDTPKADAFVCEAQQ